MNPATKTLQVKHKFLAFIAVLMAGCATRAPTKFELDRRAGLVPEEEGQKKIAEARDVRPIATAAKVLAMPHRTSPRVEKIWVYDHELSPTVWIQGTYVFLEVEPGRWSTPEKAEVIP